MTNMYVCIDDSKHEHALSVDVSNIDFTSINEEDNEVKEIELSMRANELIDGQNNDTSVSWC